VCDVRVRVCAVRSLDVSGSTFTDGGAPKKLMELMTAISVNGTVRDLCMDNVSSYYYYYYYYYCYYNYVCICI